MLFRAPRAEKPTVVLMITRNELEYRRVLKRLAAVEAQFEPRQQRPASYELRWDDRRG
jgi:hypothetical protein